MSKAKKSKVVRLKPFEKVLTVMISGKPVTKNDIETLIGNEIYMYRLSTYMWHIKTIVGGVVKAIKDGRKVTAYQLVNVDEAKKYMSRVGIAGTNLAAPVKPVQSLDEIKTQEVVAKKEPAKKAKKEKVVAVAKPEDDLEVVEIEVQDAEC